MSQSEWDDYFELVEPRWYVLVFVIIFLVISGICVHLLMLQSFVETEAGTVESNSIDISEVRDTPAKSDSSSLMDVEIDEILNNPDIPEYNDYEAPQEDYIPPQETPVIEPVESLYVEDYIPPQETAVVEPVESLDTDWSADNFKESGVLYHDGVRYTWYSENVLPGGGLTELNSSGRTVNSEGYVVDQDGYIACASNDYPIGTELSTPLGDVKVYDTGCASGTLDIYTSW